MKDCTVFAILTCHNRREKTNKCLGSIYRQELPPGVKLKVIVVDDGSTDGTSESIQALFPEIAVIKGDGSLYWTGGMRKAWSFALSSGLSDEDFLLWLNDDVDLCDSAMVGLLRSYNEVAGQVGRSAIIAGNLVSSGGEHSYGAVEFPYAWRRLTPRFIYCDDKPVPADSMNGNVVLISGQALRQIGQLDERFRHSMADFDYGLRASSLGIPVFASPGFVGTCDRNSIVGTYQDPALHLKQRFSKLLSVKGRPPKAWFIYCYKYGGVLWFALWLWTYIRIAFISFAPGFFSSRRIEARKSD